VNARSWMLWGALAMAVACDDKPKPAEPVPTAPVATATPAPTPAPAATATEAAGAAVNDIATEEDFEEEAQGEISAHNMEAELDKLEKEIGD
jgi:hypothetical protein